MKINADCIIIMAGEKEKWAKTMKRIGTQKIDLAATLRSKDGIYSVNCIVTIHNAEGAAHHFLEMI